MRTKILKFKASFLSEPLDPNNTGYGGPSKLREWGLIIVIAVLPPFYWHHG